MNIADILATVHLNLETGEFEANAAKAGDKAGATFGSKLKAAAGGAIGAAAGAAFGIALVGAQQLDAATRQLQADTGMTAAEAKTASHALAGMYRDNLQGFDAIGATMAKVHNDLGLAGAAADVVTAKFLKFATATGQDASAAVSSFDDILDAWNLTADDAGSLMDKLIVSQQKYGGSLTENQAALGDMAPAMQSMNMDVDDGIALLNLFALSGIDAAKATTMLRSAVKQLKPGQDINDLIAQVAAIEDPVLRGQKAMELFGSKTGIAMAQAIKPGMKSLADLTASLGDTAGATEKAASAIESGFGAQFQMLLKNAGGALAEFGTNFGPLLMVASAFGPKMVASIGAGLGGLAGMVISKMVGAVGAATVPTVVASQALGTAAGTAGGTTFGGAFAGAAALALPAALAAAVVGIALVIPVAWDWFANEINPNIALDKERQQQYWATKNFIDKNVGKLKADAGTGLKYALVDAAEQAGAAVPPALAAGAASTATVWSGKVDEIVAFFGTSMSGVKAAALVAGKDGMAAMAAGITSARAAPLSAFDTLVTMLKTPLPRWTEAARLTGQLTSKALAAGLRSNDPAIRAQAIATKQALLDRLKEITPASGRVGTAASAAIAKGLKSKDPEIRQAALDAKGIITKAMDGTAKPAAAAGAKAGGAYVHAFAGKVADDLGRAYVPRGTGGHAPGVLQYATGTPYVPFDMTAQIHQGEIIVPKVQSDEIRAGRASLGAGTTNISVNLPTTARPDPFEVATQLRRLADFGVLSPRRVPA